MDTGIIINPAARKVAKKYIREKRFWEKSIPPGKVWVTKDLDHLDHALQKAREKGLKNLAIFGGDGTIQVTLTRLLMNWAPPLPVILPLPGGTMNALCHNLGLAKDPKKVLEQGLLLDQKDPRELRRKFLIRVQEGRGRELFGFTFANGVIFHAFGDYYRSAEPGVRDAVRVTLTGLASGLLPSDSGKNRLRPINAKVLAGGKPVAEGPVRVVSASALDNPVLWFKPFPNELNGCPRFHCVVNSMNAKDIILNAWPLMRGRTTHPKHYVDQVSEMEINTDQGYILDGEVYELSGQTSIRISTGPAMTFLAPLMKGKQA